MSKNKKKRKLVVKGKKKVKKWSLCPKYKAMNEDNLWK